MALAGLHTARTVKVLAVAITMAMLGLGIMHSLAAAPADPAFERTWARADKPVADGAVSRTWMWGPEANTGAIPEPYQESPDGVRTVQYFDKSRMEITSPDADEQEPWYVTNGLLVNELISGRVQIGHELFDVREPAGDINVAGDPDDPNGPTYATIGAVLDAPALADGAAITQRLARDGSVTNDPALASAGVTAAHHVQVVDIDHQVASPFWEFMTSEGIVYEDGEFVEDALFENPFYATGYPIAEAYWASVKVEGTLQDVLIQCFERRCLTYTPGNVAGWEVEAGNVGQHYYRWRYPNGVLPTPSPTPPPTPTPPATPEPLPAQQLFVAYLSGANHVTDGVGIDPLDTDGTGLASFYVEEDGSSIKYQIVVDDLKNITAAHIHDGDADENGPVVVPLFTAAADTSVTPDGVLVEGAIVPSQLPDGITISYLANRMLDGEVYVNVHTTAHPAGEIRGQIGPLYDTIFTATLNGENQIPPTVTDATGEATFIYTAASDTIGYRIELSDISGLTIVHIHSGSANITGPILSTLFVSEIPLPYFNDEITGRIGADDLEHVTVDEFVYLMLTGNAYVDAHTIFNPYGEIRGQFGVRE